LIHFGDGAGKMRRLVEAALQIRRAQAKQSDPSQNRRSQYRAEAFDHPGILRLDRIHV
jgi:hypothetical protein